MSLLSNFEISTLFQHSERFILALSWFEVNALSYNLGGIAACPVHYRRKPLKFGVTLTELRIPTISMYMYVLYDSKRQSFYLLTF